MLVRRAITRLPIRAGSETLRSRWLHSSVRSRGLLGHRSTCLRCPIYGSRILDSTAPWEKATYSTSLEHDRETQENGAEIEENLREESEISSTERDSTTILDVKAEAASFPVQGITGEGLSSPAPSEEEIPKFDLGFAVSKPDLPEVLSYPDPTTGIPTTPIIEKLPLPEAEGSDLYPHVLPAFCPGCGAASHSGDPQEPGYYGPENKMPKPLKTPPTAKGQEKDAQQRIYEQALAKMSEEAKEMMREANMKPPDHPSHYANEEEDLDDPIPLESLPGLRSSETESWFKALKPESLEAKEVEEIKEVEVEVPSRHKILCSRCRSLLNYQSTTVEGPDATFAQAAEMIAKSRFRRIHVYHIIDAADFPMSVLPNARKAILAGMNSLKAGKGKDISLSFVITRADLLMPTEQKVTSLMTYIRRVLNNYMDDADKERTLKELRIVSAKNNWTTERLKDEIRGRKGGVVLLGKTNVGKSRLFEAIFPKRAKGNSKLRGGEFGRADLEAEKSSGEEEEFYIQNGRRVRYPEMPLASKIPGTTVGPIVIDFAAGRGQLIDLPGFRRGGLMTYVRPELVKSTVMVDRINPRRYIVPEGRAFLLGGLVTVKPVSRDTGRPVTLEIAVFSTVPGHVTKEAKLDQIKSQDERNENSEPENRQRSFIWTRPKTQENLESAGIFKLTDDITKKRSGPLVEGMGEEKFKKVSFRVYATDIVVEGLGWLEISAQVGKNDPHPEIEVWSPNGGGILQRETMKAYEEIQKPGSKVAPGSRPRKSMKGAKKAQKKELRMLQSKAAGPTES